jgi:PKHD-type hydroxylase
MKCDPLYWYWKAELPDSLCDAIITEGLKLSHKDGQVGDGEGIVDDSIRKSKVAFFPCDSWVSAITTHYMHRANTAAWNFDITGAQDPQFTIYNPGEFYDFHSDCDLLEGSMRKLSVVITITDPNTYTDGEFEFDNGEKPDIKSRGSVMVFPSFLRHRVTPVEIGVRYSLVNWFVGPQFK